MSLAPFEPPPGGGVSKTHFYMLVTFHKDIHWETLCQLKFRVLLIKSFYRLLRIVFAYFRSTLDLSNDNSRWYYMRCQFSRSCF